jgi:hypothetical protein
MPSIVIRKVQICNGAVFPYETAPKDLEREVPLLLLHFVTLIYLQTSTSSSLRNVVLSQIRVSTHGDISDSRMLQAK